MSFIVRQDALSVKEWKNELAKYWLYKWKIRAQKLILFRNYDNWCDLQDDYIKQQWIEYSQEIQYASTTGMDSIEWCWGCKYGDCERHSACFDCKLGNCERCW